MVKFFSVQKPTITSALFLLWNRTVEQNKAYSADLSKTAEQNWTASKQREQNSAEMQTNSLSYELLELL